MKTRLGNFLGDYLWLKTEVSPVKEYTNITPDNSKRNNKAVSNTDENSIFQNKNKKISNLLIYGGLATALAGYGLGLVLLKRNGYEGADGFWTLLAGVSAVVGGGASTAIGISIRNNKQQKEETEQEEYTYEKFCERKKEMYAKLEENDKLLEDIK